VGAPYTSPGGREDAGSALVYSGADGSLLHQFHGVAIYDRFGFTVSSAGDFNQDGHADLLVGAPLQDVKVQKNTGAVYLYSGKDGRLLYRVCGSSSIERFGPLVANAGDVNADGRADIIVGSLAISATVLSFPPPR
jgi:FG-GAP repeat protein